MRELPSFFLLTAKLWTWFHRFGGPGLILLGIIDNSVIPVPGSMDVVVILLSAHHRPWWPYYSFMATAGAVIGGFVTYRLAEKGEKAIVEKKVGRSRAEKVYRRFEKHGFATVSISAVLPPPFPMVPVLLAAGALHYPRKKFVGALATGRATRFFLEGYLAQVYGKVIIESLSRYYKPVLYSLLGLLVLAVAGVLAYFKWYRPKRQRQERNRGAPVEQFPIPFRKQQKPKAE